LNYIKSQNKKNRLVLFKLDLNCSISRYCLVLVNIVDKEGNTRRKQKKNASWGSNQNTDNKEGRNFNQNLYGVIGIIC
jgi:hypothetical protein